MIGAVAETLRAFLDMWLNPARQQIPASRCEYGTFDCMIRMASLPEYAGDLKSAIQGAGVNKQFIEWATSALRKAASKADRAFSFNLPEYGSIDFEITKQESVKLDSAAETLHTAGIGKGSAVVADDEELQGEQTESVGAQSATDPLARLYEVSGRTARKLSAARQAVETATQKAADKLKTIVLELLSGSPTADYPAKRQLAAQINAALEAANCRLTHSGLPCELTVTQESDQDAVGKWVLTAFGKKAEPLVETECAKELLPLAVDPRNDQRKHEQAEQKRQGSGNLGTADLIPLLKENASPDEIRTQLCRASGATTPEFGEELVKWFRAQKPQDRQAKDKIAEVVNLLLELIQGDILCKGERCYLQVSAGSTRPLGRFRLTPRGSSNTVDSASQPEDLEPFVITSPMLRRSRPKSFGTPFSSSK